MTKRIFDGGYLEGAISDEEVIDYLRARYSISKGELEIPLLRKHIGQAVRLGGYNDAWKTDLETSRPEESCTMSYNSLSKLIRHYDESVNQREYTASLNERYAKTAYTTFDKEAIARFPDRVKVPWDGADERIQDIFRTIISSVREDMSRDYNIVEKHTYD